jgi:hypothetical protein
VANLSLNVLAQTVSNRNALNTWIAEAQPRAILVMDDVALARGLARQYPHMLVVHRRFQPDDARLHHRYHPTDWVQRVASDGQRSVVVQCLNEPSGYEDLLLLAAWTAAAMKAAHERNIRLALPNFAVGHPDESAIQRGALDEMIYAFGNYPQHILAVHEYFNDKPEAEPWHIGRVRTLLERFDRLNVRRPIVVVTECGRDVGGGKNDGWDKTGWGEEGYITRLLEMARIHTQSGVYASCVFCYGRGYGDDWQSFNVERAEKVLNAMSLFNRNSALRWVSGRVRRNVNKRQLPCIYSPVLNVVPVGSLIQYSPAGIRRGGYTWLPLKSGGWIAGEVAGLIA